MQSFLVEQPRKTSKTLYALAAIAVIGCIAGLAAFQYQTTQATNLIYTASDLNPTAIYDLYSHWKQAHSKLYSSVEEDTTRFGVFQDNYLFILNWNAANQTSTVALNEYADLTTAEFSALKGCLNTEAIMSQISNTTTTVEVSTVDAPTSVDWRTSGAVTAVKNQGQCGSCWSFSTTGALEGLHAIKTGSLLSFSEQQLVDCSGSYGNNGCNGGLMDYAFTYVAAKGIEQESVYPYTATQGSCKYKSASATYKNAKYTDVPSKNNDALLAAVAVQPVSIAIEADQSAFQLYSGGVLSSTSCGTSLDHGVLLVGYGTTSAGQAYWIVKNSWGSTWGEQGYIRIARQSGTGAGICGIALSASYPTA